MEITHTWKIGRLDKINDGTGTVKKVSAFLWSTNGEVSVSIPTEVELTTDSIENFVEYEDLTEDDVVSWVMANLTEDLSYFESENERFIEREMERIRLRSNPETIPSKPPWQTP